MERLNWDEVFFLAALVFSTRGTCDRLRTACVIVKDSRFRGVGYNGSVEGLPHCSEAGHLMIDGHCERTIHGEDNAIMNTERKYLKGSTAYIIGTPCLPCTKKLIQAGVNKILYTTDYDNSKGKDYIQELAGKKQVVIQKVDVDICALIDKTVSILKSKGGVLYKAGKN